MPDGVSPRPMFARAVMGPVRRRATSVSVDLPKRRHSLLPPSAGAVEAAFGRPMRSSMSAAKPSCEVCVVVLGTRAEPSIRLCFHNFKAIRSGSILIPFHHILSSARLFDRSMQKSKLLQELRKIGFVLQKKLLFN
jgi:hypothetical protein